MDPNVVRSRASEICRQIEISEDPKEWQRLAAELVPIMIAYWDVHPHSAMEMLEVAALRLPVSLGNALVRRVVAGWREKATYDPDAGGNADHCYLSALILSENFDLADTPWVDRVLPRTIEKELRYRDFTRVRDGRRKLEIVQSIASTLNSP